VQRVLIGTAGWSVPRAVAPAFPADGSGLERYATRFGAVEINTSFYRPHRAETYAKWAAAVPSNFRFAVKLPQAITHDGRLAGAGAELDAFLDQVSGLGRRLGCVLVQLPPSLEYDARRAGAFLRMLRARHAGPVALEPRHPTWFQPPVDARLADARVARVAADPARVPAAAEPGGDPSLVYFRLHGSPETYRSSYDDARIAAIAARLRAARGARHGAWCIFDNTTLGAATANALELQARLAAQHERVNAAGRRRR
jgi:uncharacterized protein YecE (DUF72 family)